MISFIYPYFLFSYTKSYTIYLFFFYHLIFLYMEKEIFSIFFIRMILLLHSYFHMKYIYDIHIYSYNN